MTPAVTLRRLACLLMVSVALAVLGAPVLPHAGEASAASAPAASVAPVAEIDLGGLFGNENEPDENEPDEGGGRQTNTTKSSGVSIPVVVLLVLLAALAGAYAAIRVRRLWLRLRGWGREMRARF
jgi:hypothetical protein